MRCKPVALRKESVDRNKYLQFDAPVRKLSLSARRAWIEICSARLFQPSNQLSLSARRAWIEMKMGIDIFGRKQVALRKESVDRNIDNWTWTGGMW